MTKLEISKFADLFAQADGATQAEIVCGLRGTVVRKLSLTTFADGQMIVLDALSGPVVRVDLDEAVIYEPWFMDRGSMLFHCRELQHVAKLCTEFDRVRYQDGREFSLTVAGAK